MDLSKIKKEKKIDTTNTPWYKKKVSIITMSSTLGVCVLTTAIAVPVALTSSDSTATQSEPIAAFNNKSVTDKINAYNSIMANATNNDAIKKYFFTSGGMSQFFNENVQPITSGGDKAVYDEFKAFLPTYKSTSVIYTPTEGTNFLKMKAVGKIDGGDYTTNVAISNYATNIYCLQTNNLSTTIGKYTFFSPIVSTIQNVTINSDFSITINLSNASNIHNAAFQLIDTNFGLHEIPYKTTIKFSNTTLFPGMSDFVKTSILNLTL